MKQQRSRRHCVAAAFLLGSPPQRRLLPRRALPQHRLLRRSPEHPRSIAAGIALEAAGWSPPFSAVYPDYLASVRLHRSCVCRAETQPFSIGEDPLSTLSSVCPRLSALPRLRVASPASFSAMVFLCTPVE
jgi:hypothetical protein